MLVKMEGKQAKVHSMALKKSALFFTYGHCKKLLRKAAT